MHSKHKIMIIIGEKLNSSIKSTFLKMKSDEQGIIDLIKSQESFGAGYLDINTAMFEADELDVMTRMIRLVLENSSCGIMLDSSNAEVLKEASRICVGREVILNSVTSDERIESLAPIAAEYGFGIVVLPISKTEGIPETVEKRITLAKQAIEKLSEYGVSDEQIYVDALCQSLATGDLNAINAIETIKLLKSETSVKTICGVSNVSFGLPNRIAINAAFLTAASYMGLDAAIVDPTSNQMLEAFYAAEVIAGRDKYSFEYINFFRNQKNNQ